MWSHSNHKMMMMMIFHDEFMKCLIDWSHLTLLFHHFPSSKAFKSRAECFISQLYSSQDVWEDPTWMSCPAARDTGRMAAEWDVDTRVHVCVVTSVLTNAPLSLRWTQVQGDAGPEAVWTRVRRPSPDSCSVIFSWPSRWVQTRVCTCMRGYASITWSCRFVLSVCSDGVRLLHVWPQALTGGSASEEDQRLQIHPILPPRLQPRRTLLQESPATPDGLQGENKSLLQLP